MISFNFRWYAYFLLSKNLLFVLPPCWMMNPSHPTWRSKTKVKFFVKNSSFFVKNFPEMALSDPFFDIFHVVWV